MSTPTTQAQIIARGLAATGHTVATAAEALDLSESYIRHLLSGRREATNPATISRIAEVLQINADHLYAARGAVPQDVLQAIRLHPEIVQVIRSVAQRLDEQKATAHP